MKITAITPERVAVPLAEPFVISLGVIDSAEIVFTKIETDVGLVGYGEGSAPAFVTGETSDTILGAIELAKPLLVGANPFAIAEIHRGLDSLMVRNGAAKAAIDLGLYDLMAKAAGLPLYQFLGGVRDRVETDMTIGLGEPEAMAATASDLVAEGFREIKIKAGADDDQDRSAIRLIRAAAPTAHVKVDANQGWTVSRALRMLAYYADYGVGAVEQPVPFWDIDGLAQVRAKSPIPIMADESCFTPQDASRIVRAQAADTINIKLMKCGGIFRALQINAIAEAANVTTMLGCMLESRLAIAAGAHLVASRTNFLYADLDSYRDFDDSALVKSDVTFPVPEIVLPQTPGIGVELTF
ncbi:MAG: dipeptide epimerase [Propionibacteriaceae bacterium]|jgi:L-alanine-DL-glutamate epimerase-like enolase superfamily enzyme|nr:dipeptide epimerase [Propionibacteriaceae bacterium]